MSPDEMQDFRVERLKLLLERKFGGQKVALARALGHKTGAFVRQLIDRERPITEKTVAALEALPGAAGWFRESLNPPDLMGPNSIDLDADAPVQHPLTQKRTGVVYMSNGAGKSGMLLSLHRLAALAYEAVEQPRRHLVAQAISSAFEHGPNDSTFKAIDALTPELDEPASKAFSLPSKQDEFRAKAFEIAKAMRDHALREKFLDFLSLVDAEVTAESRQQVPES